MMAEKSKKRPGPVSLFRGKRRNPVSLTLTPEHHKKVETNMRRLGVTRADLLALLIEKHADSVTLPTTEHGRLRDALTALGGVLEPRKFSGPHGETWILELGGRRLSISADQSKRFALLDRCYRRGGAAAADPMDEIEPSGLAELFKRLADNNEA